MKKKVKEVTVKRSKWGKNALINKNDKMCCLGFLARACGYKKDDLLYDALPYPGLTMPNELNGWNQKYLPNDAQGDIAIINDSRKSNREELLKVEFKKYGIKIKFVD